MAEQGQTKDIDTQMWDIYLQTGAKGTPDYRAYANGLEALAQTQARRLEAAEEVATVALQLTANNIPGKAMDGYVLYHCLECESTADDDPREVLHGEDCDTGRMGAALAGYYASKE